MTFIDIIGYFASILVLISFIATSIIKIRLINLVGCIFFVWYGITIQAWPVAGFNFVLCLVQIYFLYKILKTKADYRLVKCKPNDLCLLDFISYNIKDIRKFLPEFDVSSISLATDCYFCFVNEDIAGVWIGNKCDSDFEVILEYVKDKYRDCGTGRYIYHDRKDYFKSEGIDTFSVKKIFGAHAEYLKKIGFVKGEIEGNYILDITKKQKY